MINTTIIGVDVSKTNLDVFFSDKETSRRFGNTTAGIKAFLKAIKAKTAPFVVLEPTGGYERAFIQELAENAIPYVRINPYRMRSFARGSGRLAKTDKIDAKMLAMYGKLHTPDAETPASEQDRELRDLTSRRRQLTDMVRQEKCRLEKADGNTAGEIRKHLEYLEQRLSEKDAQIKAIVMAIPKHKALYDMLVSEPGIGDQTAFVLLAEMPELGLLDGKKIAALVGVAPAQKESGSIQKEAHIKGGRGNVRQLLYMASVVASRFNPKFKEIYHSLLEKGKKPKVALTAVMRRMIVILNAKARDIFLQNYS